MSTPREASDGPLDPAKVLLMTRYIVGLEPLASLPAERAADLIAPTLQHYLAHPLTPSH